MTWSSNLTGAGVAGAVVVTLAVTGSLTSTTRSTGYSTGYSTGSCIVLECFKYNRTLRVGKQRTKRLGHGCVLRNAKRG
ncbi:hypothetical protein BC828DRAFT_390258 [Blastocladiella britannica]|nr:hypothetical protein BC828DRAFT_390258 [Blastocladiella britannica]